MKKLLLFAAFMFALQIGLPVVGVVNSVSQAQEEPAPKPAPKPKPKPEPEFQAIGD